MGDSVRRPLTPPSAYDADTSPDDGGGKEKEAVIIIPQPPKYARMTSGCACTSAGVPVAIGRP